MSPDLNHMWDYVRSYIFKRKFFKHGLFCVLKNVASTKYEAWKFLYVQFYYRLPCILYDKNERHKFLQ